MVTGVQTCALPICVVKLLMPDAVFNIVLLPSIFTSILPEEMKPAGDSALILNVSEGSVVVFITNLPVICRTLSGVSDGVNVYTSAVDSNVPFSYHPAKSTFSD